MHGDTYYVKCLKEHVRFKLINAIDDQLRNTCKALVLCMHVGCV